MITNKVQETEVRELTQNPFPGLRAFGVEESHLFFGREGQSEIILEYLSENHFAAVTGASGSGKSSLIYCGLIPILYGGFIKGTGSKWRVIATRPGNKPVRNIADALVESESRRIGRVFEDQRRNLTYALLRRSPYGLVDAVKQLQLDEDENLLLIIDQFEELFRFKDSRIGSITTLNESEAFIKLLVNAVKQRDKSIYVVLTMRSDFIGECSDFQEFTELINQSNYLVPQMTREDFREAVLGPLAVAGAKVDPQLEQIILNTIGDKSDQLPVLQHAMMRTWSFWEKQGNRSIAIGIRDYEAAGKIENALSMHANEAYEELSEEGKRICMSMFRTLTEKGVDNKGIRHPATIREIAEIAGASEPDVIEVIESFRKKGRSFITPNEKTPLESSTVIDISHESLMRVWDKLKDWVEEESSSVQMYQRLSDAASQYQLGKTGLWRPPDLHLALNWRKTQKPTLAWAKKYNPAFEKVMVFLDASEKKFNQEEQNKVRLQRRTLNRTRRFAVSMGGFTIVLLVMAFFLFYQYVEVNELRKLAEYKAVNEAGRADEELRKRKDEEYLRLKTQHEKDSLDRVRMLQLIQKDQETQEAYNIITEVTKEAEVLEQTTKNAVEERREAEQTAIQARQDQSRAEEQRLLELRKRMLSVAQSMAVKAQTIDDKNIKSLLAYQSFLFNDAYEGIDNHPDIYSGLLAAIIANEGATNITREGHEGEIRSIVFQPQKNVFYSTGGDGKIMKWDLNSNRRSGQVIYRNNFSNRILGISSNGRWLACGSISSSIQIFNLNQPNEAPKMIEAHQNGVLDLAFIPNSNKLVSTGGDRKIVVLDLISLQAKELASYEKRIRSLDFTPDGKYIYGGTDDGKLIRWDLKSGEAKTIYNNSSRPIYSVSIDKKGNNLAFGDREGYIGIIRLNSSTSSIQFKAHSQKINDLEFNSSGTQLASSSTDGTVKIWDAKDYKNRPITITEHESWVWTLAFSSDDKTLVSSSNIKDMIYLWPTRTSIMAKNMCRFITRNMTSQEWEAYVGYDINYQKTCPDKN